jgi:membrane protease YdiL (CAAX protease family)
MGDIAWGLLVMLLGQVVGFGLLAATGFVDLETGEIESLSVAMVALLAMLNWFGFVGWPIYASYVKGRRSLRADFGLDIAWTDVGWGLLGGAAGLAVNVVAGGVWRAINDSDVPNNTDFIPTSPGVVGGIALFVVIAVLTPIAEELFFRGLFLRAVAKRWNLVAGVILSSIVFGCLHATGDTLASAVFIVAVTASYGAVLGTLAAWRGRLGPSIVAHMTINSLGVLALLLS